MKNLSTFYLFRIAIERDSVALKSAMLTLVYFYIIMIVHKCQQSAAQSCSRTFELRVLPFGKTSGAKLLNFISCHLSDVFPLLEGSGKTMAFENMPMKKVHPCTFFIPGYTHRHPWR